MKIAILGATPIAIEAALYFQDMGAYVLLFEERELGGLLALKKKVAKFNSFVAEEISLNGNKKLIQYLDKLLVKMCEFCGEIKYKKVNRIHKRFLSKEELIPGCSRLADLFRVVYQGRYSEEIEKQRKENPDFFKNLDNNMIESLKGTLEHFTDVDLVIDATLSSRSLKGMGPGGVAAINEELLGQEKIYYGLSETLLNLEQVSSVRELTLQGDQFDLIYVLLALKDKIFEGHLNITIVTNRKSLWEVPPSFSPEEQLFYKKKIEEFITIEQKRWDESIRKFEEEIFKWRDLEDYERAKIPMPKVWKRRLEIYQGWNITNVDKLIDKNEMYLTLESPDFRNQDNKEILKTIATDMVFVFNGRKDYQNDFWGNMLPEWTFEKGDGFHETGFYKLSEHSTQIEEIKNNMMKYFGKRDE